MPDTAVDPTVIELAQSVGLLVRRMRAAGGTNDLSLTQSAVMARLEKFGPATTADLARAEGVKPQSMGATVAALEEMGIVERVPHPTDGRQWNVVLTSHGAALRRTTQDAKWNWLAQAISHLDSHEQQTLFAAGEIIKRMSGRAAEA